MLNNKHIFLVLHVMQVERMLKGEETISQDSKKFQNRPTFRTLPLELLDEDEFNSPVDDSPKSSSDTPKSAIDPSEIIHEITLEP